MGTTSSRDAPPSSAAGGIKEATQGQLKSTEHKQADPSRSEQTTNGAHGDGGSRNRSWTVADVNIGAAGREGRGGKLPGRRTSISGAFKRFGRRSSSAASRSKRKQTQHQHKQQDSQQEPGPEQSRQGLAHPHTQQGNLAQQPQLDTLYEILPDTNKTRSNPLLADDSDRSRQSSIHSVDEHLSDVRPRRHTASAGVGRLRSGAGRAPGVQTSEGGKGGKGAVAGGDEFDLSGKQQFRARAHSSSVAEGKQRAQTMAMKSFAQTLTAGFDDAAASQAFMSNTAMHSQNKRRCAVTASTSAHLHTNTNANTRK